ncbi:MAG: SGNH/GDSL hydrolase family protein [Lachnospiraceae bacterium]|nr:SGNH/GDSL hydrolase family protein [Lachnospiraceae bacterium]
MDHIEFGRCGNIDGSAVLFWSSSAVEIMVKAESLSVEIEADYNVFEIWADFVIDGELSQRIMLRKGLNTYQIFRGFDRLKAVKVRIIRDTQFMPEDDRSHMIIRGFDIDGEIVDPPKYDTTLEFIGDSITSGEGCGLTNHEEWVPAVFDAVNAYPYLVAKAMNARYNVLSQSGWGVYSSWNGDTSCVLPDYYEKICGQAGSDKELKMGAHNDWNFEGMPVNAVIVNLGTNDVNTRKLEIWSEDKYNELFMDKAVAFLSNIRKHNPDSLIVWAYGMLGKEIESEIKEVIRRHKEKYGDDNVFYLPLDVCTEDLLGVRAHPNPKAHQLAAQKIVEFLKQHIS